MLTASQTGRIVGALSLSQMAIAILVNFVLLYPVLIAPGFLVNAAAHPTRMALAALLGIVPGLLSIGIAVTAFRVFRQDSEAWALWFTAIAVLTCAVNAVESINLMSQLSLSQAYTNATGTQRDLLPLLRSIGATRNWAHYFGLLLGGSNLLVFYISLLRFALVPRTIAVVGVAAALLQLTAVTMPLFGHDILFPMLAPIALVHLTAAVWMLVRGWPANVSSTSRTIPAPWDLPGRTSASVRLP